MCADGFRVIATFRTGLDAAHRLRDELGGALSVEAVDGGDARAVADFVAGLGDRKIDLLVNNAGISHAALASKATGTEAEAVFRTNLFQAVHYVGAVLPLMMRRRSGDIVMVSSLAAGNVRSGNCLYGASKAALERYALGVNAISSGPIRTSAAIGLPNFQEMLAKRAHQSPLGKNVDQSDVANTAAFLLSDLSGGTTGTVLHVDGGYHVMGTWAEAAAETPARVPEEVS